LAFSIYNPQEITYFYRYYIQQKNKMKKIVFSLLFISIAFLANAQSKIPSVEIKKVAGENFNTSMLSNDGKPMIISFWATWCKPCVQELTAISEVYEEWQKETGVKVIAISTDDSRNSARVTPFVNARNWTYDVYLDPNGDFKRALNVNNIPHTFLVNGKGEIVWQHNSYTPGDEEELYELLKKVAKGESIKE
jgi:cytochrome c biogenesis protein CcmG/thiol:disulfide interchange protein DsbE